MLAYSFTLFALVPVLLASPLESLRRQSSPSVTLHVTNFSAFMADPYVDGAQSNLTFHVSDTRPGFELEVDCIVPPTYFHLYAISALFDNCGEMKMDVSYSFGEKSLTVRRGWKVNETTYLTGSSTQNTNWNEQGPNANVTTFADGKLLKRTSEWLFPVTRITGGSPP